MITPLEDLSIGVRIVLTFAIVALAIFVLAIIGYLTGGWEAQGETEGQLYKGVPLDAHLLVLDKQALEASYRAHLQLLFSVWLKDDISATHRINNGIRIARRAYAHAAEQIERRERELQGK